MTNLAIKIANTIALLKSDNTLLEIALKEALDFVIANPGYIEPLTISVIEDIHSILIKELGVERKC